MAIDYYALLEVSPLATEREIREAYKKVALKSHPDRVSHNDPTRASRTQKFQQVNDAYYTLSDPQRRREYDATRGSTSYRPHHPPYDDDDQFGDVFEEMMREEGLADSGAGGQAATGSRFFGVLGGISGGVMGFIVANVPGLLAGVVVGNKLGAIRDTRGKSVYEVFQELPQGDRAKLLSDLAAKVLAHAVGSRS